MPSYDQIISSKYRALSERSFKTKLELYLFNRCYYEYDLDFSEDDFILFEIDDHLVELYERSWSLDNDDKFSVNQKLSIEEIDDRIHVWNKANANKKKKLLIAYQQRFHSVLSMEELKEVYPENDSDRVCFYTELSDQDISRFRAAGQIKTKVSRGRIMEIDRLNSNKEYSKANIVLACYWANNAKTDEFTVDEFKNEIGPGIREVFQKRVRLKFGDS